MTAFNYLITIHNKEELLQQVLEGAAACAGPGARIIPVLDGCTDASEAIAQRFASTCGIDTRIVIAPDVHEILSINRGLEYARDGYCVILQDDVILQEPDLEAKVQALCEQHRRRIGYISFRMAVDLRLTPFYKRARMATRIGASGLAPSVEETRYVAGPAEHLDVPRVPFEQFVPRMAGIKSPVCLTPELRALEPRLDEDLAPYCYDDVDLSLRALRHGLTNGLFAVRCRSDVEWGGTRKDPLFSASFGYRIRCRNRALIWRKHGRLITELLRRPRADAALAGEPSLEEPVHAD